MMFKIGEFSRLGQVSTRMLRHYDKLGLLVPEHVDEWTDYRYYTIQQLPRLHRIIALKEMGLSLSQIADLLDEDDDLPAERLRGMLLLKRRELTQEIRETEQRLTQVEARLTQLEREDGPSPYEIVVKPVAPLPVATLRQRVGHVSEMEYYCRALTQALYRQLQAARITWTEPELILYHAEEYQETDLDVEACVALPKLPADLAAEDQQVTFRQLPGHELMASLIYEGSFMQMVPAVLELLRWVGLQHHVPVGPLRELHLSGPAHAKNATPTLPVIELQVPINAARKQESDKPPAP
ncbi:MAG: helix-turn-helix domain-containing protein [Chloroflexota bacterium]|jgi:DNA-binding transcriptional MerR regulator